MTLEEVISEIEHSVRLGVPTWTPSEAIINALLMLKDYKQLKEDYIELDKQFRAANTENGELKRLLRLAVDDIGKLKNCEKYPFCGGCPKESEPLCKWKHHDEAMELLGGTEDAEN